MGYDRKRAQGRVWCIENSINISNYHKSFIRSACCGGYSRPTEGVREPSIKPENLCIDLPIVLKGCVPTISVTPASQNECSNKCSKAKWEKQGFTDK